MKIRQAVIPVAGLGTRFLPATKAIPKEMLTIVDRPTIQYIVGDDMVLSKTPCAKQLLNLFDEVVATLCSFWSSRGARRICTNI